MKHSAHKLVKILSAIPRCMWLIRFNSICNKTEILEILDSI